MPGKGQDPYSMVWSLLTEPIYKSLLLGAAFEYSRPARDPMLEDESVGSFLERRLGSADPGNNIVSAVLHGIYAGDIYQLSAKSLLQKMWYMEGVNGSISKSMYLSFKERSNWIPSRDATLLSEMSQKVNTDLLKSMNSASVYTFKEGIGALSGALERSLRANSKVQFRLKERITELKYDGESDGVKVLYDPVTRLSHRLIHPTDYDLQKRAVV